MFPIGNTQHFMRCFQFRKALFSETVKLSTATTVIFLSPTRNSISHSFGPSCPTYATGAVVYTALLQSALVFQ